MGIFGLKNYIRKNLENGRCVKYIPLSYYRYKRIALDFYNFLHKFLQRSSIDDDYLMEFINLIHKLSKYNIEIIFVIDGKPLKEKHPTLIERKKNNQEKIQKITEQIKIEKDTIIRDENIEKLKKINYNITLSHITKSKELFDTLGIKYLHFDNFEADIIFKYLSDYEIVDACYSNDMDLLAYGCKEILNDLDFNTDIIVQYNYNDIIKQFQITSNEFIDLCICSGTDYNKPLINSKLETNIKLIKEYKSIENILNSIDDINYCLNNTNSGEIKEILIPSEFNYKKVREIYKFELPKDDKIKIISGFTNNIINIDKIRMSLKNLVKLFISNRKKPKYVYKIREFAYYKYMLEI